jgi:hypothetical protein
MELPHRIAIVGAGLIGSALAGHLILGGSSGPGDSQRRGRVVRRGYRDRLAGAVIIDPQTRSSGTTTA